MQNLLDIEATWGERLRAEGKVEGERQMLLHLLSLMFGTLPSDLVTQINMIDDEATLNQLAQQIVTIERLDQLVLPEREVEATNTKSIREYRWQTKSTN